MMLRVTVSDSGIGIDTDKQAQLFEPFNRLGKETGEIEGTGIGLTITRQLVEAMNGRVGFESEPGKGSQFWVELPEFHDKL
jgi:signal transduction histidine kinase